MVVSIVQVSYRKKSFSTNSTSPSGSSRHHSRTVTGLHLSITIVISVSPPIIRHPIQNPVAKLIGRHPGFPFRMLAHTGGHGQHCDNQHDIYDPGPAPVEVRDAGAADQ